MKITLEVDSVVRGDLPDINLHKVRVLATDSYRGPEATGARLTYWTTVDDAPHVGDALTVEIEDY